MWLLEVSPTQTVVFLWAPSMSCSPGLPLPRGPNSFSSRPRREAGAPPPASPAARPPGCWQTLVTAPSHSSAPAQPGSQRAGARQLLGKPQAKLPRSHRDGFFFFFFKESSDVTVWWQESYPVSSSSSHHSPPLRTCCPAAESTVWAM